MTLKVTRLDDSWGEMVSICMSYATLHNDTLIKFRLFT